MQLTSTVLALAGAVIAAPQAVKPISPPWQQSRSFTFVTNVTGSDLTPSINGAVLTSYHVGAGEGRAVLSTTDAGRIFYLNGTAEQVRYNGASVLSSGGTPPFPYGIVVSDAPATEVYINAGVGSDGVGLARFPSPVTYLTVRGGSYVACNDATLPYGPAIGLNVRAYDQPVPEGCAEVNLLPQCSAGDGETHEFDNIVNCYEDVASIDWSLYLD